MAIPESLRRIVDAFADAPPQLRVQALLDYAERLPPLPSGLAEDPGRLERVHECQTPFFVASTLHPDGTVSFHFDAPRESPTTRGYAGILAAGLNGQPPSAILDVPDDFYVAMGLEQVVTPLRLRGMGAILARMKRQVSELAAEADARHD